MDYEELHWELADAERHLSQVFNFDPDDTPSNVRARVYDVVNALKSTYWAIDALRAAISEATSQE